MLQTVRTDRILSLLEDQRACSIAALAQDLGVSEETIRRDVRRLEKVGRVSKVHGGVRIAGNHLEGSYRARMREAAAAKQAIGTAAARIVEPGMTILIDSGTTSFWTARALSARRGVTIVTNSLDVATEILGQSDHRLFFTGGALNVDYRAAFDPTAIAFARQFVFDVAILSIGAIEARHGFLDFDPDEAHFKRALLDRFRRSVIVADRSKFDRNGTRHVADFGAIGDLVSDAAPAGPLAIALAEAGTRVAVVSDDSAG
ncbi:DeoR/GlpR family DNA-binding transcription regulator [uncultured Sphingomonas sp.]|uniref:DeoR/GlpR family DNA-binding transcription regulator n=1 Tax=uncultured Sphingomonas sp. TaxID=158754 RepID=UPI0030FB82BB